jgi:hypothetical protein
MGGSFDFFKVPGFIDLGAVHKGRFSEDCNINFNKKSAKIFKPHQNFKTISLNL